MPKTIQVPADFILVLKDLQTAKQLTSNPRKWAFGEKHNMTLDEVHDWMLAVHHRFDEITAQLIQENPVVPDRGMKV